jgi:hypothetical protein
MDRGLNFVVEEKRTIVDTVTRWGPRLAIVTLFVLVYRARVLFGTALDGLPRVLSLTESI